MSRPKRSVPLAAAILLAWVVPGAATQHAAAKEDALKAAFVYRIASFVSWPAAALGPEGRPLQVVVVGDADLAAHLEEAFADRQIQSRAVRVVSVAERDQAGKAHLLFLSERLGAPAGGPSRAPVLTMSDAKGFAAQGGMVELVRDGPRMRFELNAGSVQRAGLKLSSQVLRLASQVYDAKAGG